MLTLGGFAFAAPWLLAGFAVLPALWWLLRVTPPPASTVRFPAVRLLFGLKAPEQTPAHTPLWLIAMRMLLAALLILALARPLARPSMEIGGSGPLLLVVDDGWAAASGWSDRVRLLGDLVGRAEREGRQVVLATDAPEAVPLAALQPMRAADAQALIKTLAPKPWPTDRAALLKRLDAAPFEVASVTWLCDGLDSEAALALARRLVRFGPTSVVLPALDRSALLLSPGPADTASLTVAVRRADGRGVLPVTLQALAADGHLLAKQNGSFAEGTARAEISFKMPVELRNRIDRVELAGDLGAGGVLQLDESAKRRPVGIAGDRSEGSQQPLLSDRYYLERALQPFVELTRAPIADLVRSGVGMIVVSDGAAEAAQDRAALASWIERGGIAVRFAGPLLAEAREDDLLPVTLRRGDRTIGGAMSWEKPAHLAEFPPESPFRGLDVPPDVTVARQVLAEPSPDLPDRTWATLSDGTPLVTASRRGKGWLVLVHTSASPAWSNLSISGLFVGMLRRLEELDSGQAWNSEAVLKPWQVMDGFGRLGAAPGTVQPILARDLDSTPAGPGHPPGLYGTEESHAALNLGTTLPDLRLFPDLPLGTAREAYDRPTEIEFRPTLLGMALVLLLADIIIGFWLRGLMKLRGREVAVALFSVVLLHPVGAWADGSPDSFVIEATRALRLAYVKTGDDQIDQVSRDGLAGLGAILARRTSVQAGEPMEVDVETDELIFFPLIYWPLSTTQAPLSPAAAARVDRYLQTGGIILFDMRGQDAAGQNGDASARLNALLAGVRIPPLVQIPADHVLTKSFYLVQDFPGRWDGGPLWVEPQADRINDGVSTIVVGSNDWAAAWAADRQGMALYPVVPGGEQQREMAYRFGVNIVMYALTGNYKADQVHVPAILERLGQ